MVAGSTEATVVTGSAVVTGSTETTVVTMDALSDHDIRSYISTREPMDKAGAYAIQGQASRWISRIEGDYFNVVGLPVSLVYKMLREHIIEGPGGIADRQDLVNRQNLHDRP